MRSQEPMVRPNVSGPAPGTRGPAPPIARPGVPIARPTAPPGLARAPGQAMRGALGGFLGDIRSRIGAQQNARGAPPTGPRPEDGGGGSAPDIRPVRPPAAPQPTGAITQGAPSDPANFAGASTNPATPTPVNSGSGGGSAPSTPPAAPPSGGVNGNGMGGGPQSGSGMYMPLPGVTGAGYGGPSGSNNTYAKGGSVKSCSYAQGGPVLGRSRGFLKGDNEFTTGKGVPQNYGKKGSA